MQQDVFVEVALPIPTPRTFTYRLAADMRQDHILGARVLAPFGKRILTGVIVSDAVDKVPERTREIIEILDLEPTFSPMMLKFTRWIAEYYMASWGDTLKAALPQGMNPETVARVTSIRGIEPEDMELMRRRAPKRAELLEEIMAHDNALTVGYLDRKLGGGALAARLNVLEQAGYISVQRSVSDDLKAKTQRALALGEELQHDAALMRATLDELDRRSPKQSLLLSHVYLHYSHSEAPLLLSDALQATGAPASSADGLVNKGYLIKFDAEVFRGAMEDGESLARTKEDELPLTLEQQHALDRIVESLEKREHKTCLLHGVTGSGKTLIYIRAIRRALDMGLSALLLAPEIALTPQLIDRFRLAFGDDIAVFHSAMSAGERYDNWRAAHSGRARIVIGTRSAVFTPLLDPGIIIVDEEHDGSYKQSAPAPRYNARDCSIVRGRMQNAVVLLGSATPSLESMYNAQNGKYHLLEIRKRADGATLPEIRVLDMLALKKQQLVHDSFSAPLLDEIIDRVKRKEGVILLQNLRGFAPYLDCPECGEKPMCPNCSVTLTYHRYHEVLRCHYCGYSHKSEKVCRFCGHPELNIVGAGTQRIEDELSKLLQEREVNAVIQRMDLDTTSRKGSHRRILTSFAKGETDILLGTQMVSKGMDFARVTLVGVVNADIQMALPDFRATERTYQLLTQVAGRAGRSADGHGLVIIQSRQPKHPAILATKAESYELFYGDELQQRREVHYPPFTRFVRIEFSGRVEEQVHLQANYFAYNLPRKHQAYETIGPAIPTINRLRRDYRRLVIVKNYKDKDPSGATMRHAVLHAFQLYNKKHGTSAVRVTLDVDSSGFM